MEDDMFIFEFSEDIKGNFTIYVSQDWAYFGNTTYVDKNLEMLYAAINNFGYVLSRTYFLHKKALLDYKVVLLDRKNS